MSGRADREAAAARPLEAYAFQAQDKLRYGDTDRQGHVNNANFATFYETARVEVLFESGMPVAPPGTDFVIARLAIDFISEIKWPGTVLIGSEIVDVGRTSCRLKQAIFQDSRCVSISESVLVLMDNTTRSATSIPDDARKRLLVRNMG